MSEDSTLEIAQFSKLLVREARRRLLEESLPRLRTCLGHLSEEDVWLRPNPETSSVGNLILHLCGNVTQWILSGLGGLPDHRQRSLEFSQDGICDKQHLYDLAQETLEKAVETLESLPPEEFLRTHPVQIYEETGVAIVVHVIEHFSYHVGQIGYFVKTRKGIDLGYYRGVPLEGIQR